MKRIAALLCTAFLLAGCSGGENEVSYSLTFDTTDAARVKALTEASERVIQRRAYALEEKVLSVVPETVDGKTMLKVGIADAAKQAQLTEGLLSPFSFRLMREAAAGEQADATAEKYGSFKETGITEKQIDWLIAGTDPQTLKGAVQIQFTSEGKELLKKVIQETKGRRIGLFLRGKLVSQLQSDGKVQDNIEISGIPSKDVAEIFADDVNVGVHVRFASAR